jgi:hypothetical protein
VRVTSLLLLTLAVACSTEGQAPPKPVGAAGGAEGPSGGAVGGSGPGGLGGSAGSLAGNGGATTGGEGGAAGAATGGTRTGDGGTSGGGAGSGGVTERGDGSVGGAVVSDGARERGSTGGGAPAGGSGSGGSSAGVAGSGAGGSVGSDAKPTGDAGADATVSKDSAVAVPDAYVIPDLPNRQDAAAEFWTTAYAANCTPPAYGGRAQTDGHHRPGENCMTSGCHLNPKKAEHHAGTDCRGSGCHSNGSPDGSGAPAFLFGGTAYHAVTLAAEVAAEVRVLASDGFYSACTASNGNFWYMAPSGKTSLRWTGATTRLRNANGQAPMMTAPAAGCNASTCHTKTMKITAP